MLSERQKRAKDIFSSNRNCAQAVLLSFLDQTKLDMKQALSLAACMGGGMRCGTVCGAVTGALMVLGTDNKGSLVSKAVADARARAFHARFCALHGSIICNTLLQDDFSDPEGRLRLENRGAFKTYCPQFVMDAVGIVEQLRNEDAE